VHDAGTSQITEEQRMRKFTCLLGVLLLLIAVMPALADSISPPTYSNNTLAIGDSVTVHKTLTVNAGAPTTTLADVFFLADTTGSMGGAIGSVAASASSILSSTTGIGNVQWGVGEYRDFGDVFVYRLDTAITANTAAVQNGINMWSASGGGDYPEAQLYGLYQLSTQAATGWRPGSARILVWMGDSPGHDPSGGITEAMATSALVNDGIKVLAVNMSTLDAYGQASRITAATGGHLYNGVSTSSIVSTILGAITTAFTTYSSVSLDLTGVGPDITATSTPGFTGSFDRSVDRTFDFDVTFTRTGAGVDTFNIYGLVDRARVATEVDTFGGTVPEPGSILFLVTVVAGIGTALRRRLA
jgi:hypothetical protein